MTGLGQTFSADEVKAMLLAQRHAVARHYARPASGSYEDKGGWWTLNPGRADRSVGSFVVWLEGPRMGRWNDYATGEHGDLLDLIALSLGCSLGEAFREARGFLGLQSDSPEDVERRRAGAARAIELAAEAARRDRAEKDRRRRAGVALWLSAQDRIAGTPVEYYLRGRGIDLARLGRQPRALRYHPDCFYTDTDPATGEVIEARYPAMLAVASNAAGQSVACHRTYLAIGADGCWRKAPVSKPKKVLGDFRGAAIHLWSGLGPRGGKAKRLAEAEPGSHVYLSEGIEDALSCVMMLPSARVLAAISLSNFGAVVLPDTISDVTLIADQDESPQARAALDRAVATHAAAGRRVRVWRNHEGGKDLNDALQRRRAEREKGAVDGQ